MSASRIDDRPSIRSDPNELAESDGRGRPWLIVACGVVIVLVAGWGYWTWLSSTGAAGMLRERQRLDETVWREEVEAQHYEEFFVSLWDDLRATPDPLNRLSLVSFKELLIGQPGDAVKHDWNILTTDLGEPTQTLDQIGFAQKCQELASQGYRIIQTEWHHSRFESNEQGQARSQVSVRIDAENQDLPTTRYTITGDILVEWEPLLDEDSVPRPESIDASGLTITQTSGPPAFEVVTKLSMRELGAPVQNAPSIIVYDLDRDGLSELLIPAANMVFHNRGGWQFDRHSLVASASNSEITASLLADFDGDARPDLLCAGAGFALLYRANEHGDFPSPSEDVAGIGDSLIYPSVLTAGDIDADGDLDVWLAQYKPAYHFGQMPTPYYDANDGFPSYLLLNDGSGHFQDATDAWGLTGKRHRRTYGASLVDLDGDQDLDLAVASDYSGLDLYLNEGGQFRDVTSTLAEHRHCFGMSLTFGDYDRDQQLDLYMTGMASTTARRLEALGLGRPEFPEHQRMRSVMGYGNRMYLGKDNGFSQAAFNDQVARTGWSWGSTSFDFDNDTDVDIYVANGHRSNQTAKDYCSRFWTHDIYTGSSEPNPQVTNFFQQVLENEFSTISWNGFEHNCLLMNESGTGFKKVGFLMGVAFEFDSRNVISEDFDGDGRRDLLVVGRLPNESQASVFLVRNNFQTENHWIGLQLYEQGTGRSPIGASVAIEYADTSQVSAVVTGDSLYSQHSSTVHFGLGSHDSVDRILIKYNDGTEKTIEHPEVDRYHTIRE